jgi:ribosomal protein S18 acetylase RimI-like enzyme
MSAVGEMAETWGQIAVYDPSMAPKVAEMFNAFNESWPGGFGGRVPYDEQRVRDWLDETSAVADLIALAADGEPVGYCGLYPHWRDRHAAYVSVLGVIPRVKGKKYGKRLLLRAIELAGERGISRVDLHTWSGNLDAVPLYKKVGMHWVPETSVYMQDYLPGLLRMPLAAEWFDRHPDWYGCFQRELSQAPDKHVVDGMELYEYAFEVGDDRLVAEVDRYGWGFCGIERALDGERIAVRTRLRAHDILMGISNELTVIIDNGTDEDLAVALTVEPFQGLTWEEPFPLSLSVPAGECTTVARRFVVDHTAETYKHEASEVVRTRVNLRGKVLDLVTGGKIRPAVELTSEAPYHVGPVGSETTVCLDLYNHSKQTLEGRVDLYVEGLPERQQSTAFVLAPEEVSGIEVAIVLPRETESPVHMLHAAPSIKVDETQATMPAFRFPVVADVPDLGVVVRKGDEKWVHLLTDQLDVAVQLEGGSVRIHRRTVPGMSRRVGFAIGPPFGLTLDRTLEYAYETIRDGPCVTLILCARSLQSPDLEIRKHIRIVPGVREVEQWAMLTSRRVSGTAAAGGRTSMSVGGGLSINPYGSAARAFTPVGGRVIESDPILPFVSDQFVPQEPERWPETWTAVQNMAHGDLAAWFWKPEGVSKVKVSHGSLSSLESETTVLQPGERVEVCHLWYGFSYQSLSDVRNRWSQLVGHVEIPHAERQGVQAVPPVRFTLAGERWLGAGTARRTVEARFATSCPLRGELSLDLPTGWQGTFVTPDGRAETVPMPDPVPGEPILIEVELTVPRDTRDASAAATLHLSGEFELDFGLPLLLTRGDVDIGRKELEGQEVMAVSNGALSFVVSGLGGNLIRLLDAEGRAFLYDQFPEVRPRFFIDHYIGGVQPTILMPDAEVPFVEPERVDLAAVEDGAWRGVRASWTVHNVEKLRGQAYSVTYLVLPGCPVVRVRLAHQNPVPRRVNWVALLVADLAIGGDCADMTLHVPGGIAPWVRSRPQQQFINQANVHEPWMWAGKGEQSLTFLSPDGYPGAVVAADLQVMVLALSVAQIETAPREDTAVEFALAVNQLQCKTAELIRALGREM